MKVKLIVDGGNMKPGPAVAQQLGPMGINLGKVISSVNEATAGFKGTKVPVEIDVNTKTKDFTIKVFSPPVAELIKKELKIEKGSGQALNVKVGNIAFEKIVGIAKTKMPNLLCRTLKSAVKVVAGSCVSAGVLIDSKEAKIVEKEIDEGKYNKIIEKEITEPSPEKQKELDAFFTALKEKQEKEQKAIQEAKAAAEAAKAEATAAAPAEGTAPEAAAVPAKKEEKKEEKKSKK